MEEAIEGRTDYELARRYLKAIYKLRDAIGYVRDPFISLTEIATALKESGQDESRKFGDKESNRAVYDTRWKKIVEASSDLDLELREAEVSWGSEAVEVQGDLRTCVKKLYLELKKFLREGGVTLNDEIIYRGGANNTFDQSIESAVQKIEEYLKPHLR